MCAQLVRVVEKILYYVDGKPDLEAEVAAALAAAAPAAAPCAVSDSPIAMPPAAADAGCVPPPRILPASPACFCRWAPADDARRASRTSRDALVVPAACLSPPVAAAAEKGAEAARAPLSENRDPTRFSPLPSASPRA